MATVVTRYVNPGSSGGDGTTQALSGASAAYASLQACLDAERADLVAADVQLDIICATSGPADTTPVNQNVAGWTTDATRYVHIKPAAGHRASTEWSDAKYRLTHIAAANVNVLIMASSVGGIHFSRVEGLQLQSSWANLESPTRAVSTVILSPAVVNPAGADMRFFGNHVRWVGTKAYTFTNVSYMVYGDPSNASASPVPNFYIYNNILSDETVITAHSALTSAFRFENRAHNVYFWNNTVRGPFPYAFSGSNESTRLHYLKNNLASGIATAFVYGTYVNSKCDYNATSHATLGYTAGANDRVSQTFTFVSATDHALASGDTGAKGFGLTDPSGGMFLDDIDGNVRDAPWDIGAHEWAAPIVLTVADATHAHTADSVALTQANTLVSNDAQHAHTADNVVLTQSNTLVSNDATHAHTADSPAISVTVVLVSNDATHAHTTDSLALIVATVVEFVAASGQTLTAQLFAVNSDSIVATSFLVAASPNRGLVYRAVFADALSPGTYLLVAFEDSTSATPVCSWYVVLDGVNSVHRSGNYADVVYASELSLLHKIARNKTVTNPAGGLMTVYDDDGTTPLLTAQLYENVAETQTYRGQGAEVRERLE